MLWRLEPLLYPNIVNCFISRDIDTRIQPREVYAVREWIESNRCLHIMRDHPQHYPRILGGMYGLKCINNYIDQNLVEKIEEFYKLKGEDVDEQNFLFEYIYSQIPSNERIIHDEIKKYEGEDECKQFPIKFEKSGRFVGCYVYENNQGDIETENVLKEWLKYNLSDRVTECNISLHDKLMYIRSKIDNIYVMHYTKLYKRKENMNAQLYNTLLSNFYNIKWVEDFDREKLSLEFIQNNVALNMTVFPRRMTLPEIANGLGYRETFKKIVKEDKVCLFLEDDTIFKPNFVDHLYYVLKNLPEDYDMVCLGGPTNDDKIPEPSLEGATKEIFKSEDIVIHTPKIPCTRTVSCMLYKKEGLEKVLSSKFIHPLICPIDHCLILCNIEKSVKVYWSQPWLSFEGSKSEKYDFPTSLERGF